MLDVATTKTAPKRRKSKLTLEGEKAQRALLLRTLKAKDWNLTATADELKMAGPGDVLRAAHILGLDEELDAARARGDLSPGNRTKK